MAIKEIGYPFQEDDVRSLKVGDTVSVSGRIYTARDRLHRHLAGGGKSPVDLKNGALYHCGPVVVLRDGEWIVKAAGPTTSMRQEPYEASVIERCGVRVLIGKGGMGEDTRKACARCGCVYLHAVGGAAALLAGSIKATASVNFLKEFGRAEAMWGFDVSGLQTIVTIDARGRSLHKRIKAASRRVLKDLLNRAP